MSTASWDAAAEQRERTRQRLEGDVVKGDPAQHVLGRPEEQPARVHAPQPPKPTIRRVDQTTIQRDIQKRLRELRPLAEEAALLEQAIKALEDL